jgi:rhamnosyltransferase
MSMHPSALTQAGATVAVVITYQPDVERLMEGMSAILAQVDRVVVVDNGSAEHLLEPIESLDRTHVLKLGSNKGIAYAQNRGIEWAVTSGAGYVLLLDQDSVAGDGMVPRLQLTHDSLKASGLAVGAVGPAQVDGLGAGLPSFTRFRRARYMQVEAQPGTPWVACDMLIASGTLISVEALNKVGLMNEGLFIDKVDTDWCLRAHRAGLLTFGVPDAKLFHRLGESVLTVTWWKGKRLPVHKPFRYYYMVRNSVLLQRTPGMRWAWRMADLSQALQIVLFHGLLAPNAGLNRPMIWRGLRDGLGALSGPMPRS